MLINLSNNPSEQWHESQKAKARDKYGLVQDLLLSNQQSNVSKLEVTKIAETIFNQIMLIFDECANDVKQNAVLINADSDISRILKMYLLESNIESIIEIDS